MTFVNIKENSNLKAIGNNAFNKCSNLTEITLPESLSIVGFQATYTSENGDVELKNSTFDVNENDEIQNIYTSDFSFLNPEMAVPLNTIYSSSYKRLSVSPCTLFGLTGSKHPYGLFLLTVL